MSEEEWTKRMLEGSHSIRVPLQDGETEDGKPIKALAYIGSGTILKDNHVLTVRHLFDHNINTYSRKIWVFQQQADHPIEADLIAITENKTDQDYWNDYAVIRLREDLGLPGIPISTKEVKLGEKVMFGCSVGGTAYFMRFGFASNWKWFFRKDAEGRLHLSKWVDYHFLTVHPSGPGDSGSGVFNIKGELVGVAYVGVNIYEQMYCFSNPVERVWEFLEKYHLAYLGYY
jgi:S1-C subfamily serine protease